MRITALGDNSSGTPLKVFCKFKKVLKRVQYYYSFSCLENMT